jgi:hypothetical protein
LNELLCANERFITPRQCLGPIEHRHVIEMDAPSLEPLKGELRRIFESENTAFKVNASFSYVLRHRIDNNYRFFYGSHGEGRLFSPSRGVYHDLARENLLQELGNLDVLEFVSEGRENSVGYLCSLQA